MESTQNSAVDNQDLNSYYTNILSVLFKDCPDGIVFKDKDFKYLAANNAFLKFYRIENPKDLIGKKCCKTLSKDNLKLVSEVNSAVEEEKQPISYIMNVEAEKGTPKIYNITTTPILDKLEFLGTISIVKDVTHEESVKERFVLKHFQLKSLLENIPMLIYMQDKNLNYIAGTKPSLNFVNEGYDAFSNIHIDKTKSKVEDDKENTYVLENNKILVKEKEVVDYKGIPHWYKIYKVPINDFNNNVTGIITLANNIDAEKQLNTQRETFVASLGHDLKNPTIAQIRGLELLLKGEFGEISLSQRELVEMVLDSCRYMNGMLSTLLATYRNNEGLTKLNYSEFSLPDLVMECVSEMIYVAKDKEVGISIDSKLEPEIVNADRVQIKRVIMNLLSNGIKYAYKDSILKLSVYKESNKACFCFENSSPYIPEERQKAIFAQYVTYAAAHKELGIGLGLYASKKIIEAHKGKIFVKSFKDNKNVFGFKIPYRLSEVPGCNEACF